MKHPVFPFLLAAAIVLPACEKGEEAVTPSSPASPSPFVAAVLEYEYAPGQHIRLLEKAPASGIIGGNTHNILLGGWGGHITAAFDHDVPNLPGSDLIIYCGNSVSPEPGVVFVMQDKNGNGLPDDDWLEIKGSETGKPGYDRNYKVTYFRPADDSANVTWADNHGQTGELPGSQNWWWHTAQDSVAYTGTLVCTDAYFNQPQANGQQYWAVPQGRFLYGYAENGSAPDRTRENGYLATDFDADLRGNRIELDSATNAQGDFAPPTSIRFVKVQTGVFQQAGWLGEISTEINGMADLHLLESNNP